MGKHTPGPWKAEAVTALYLTNSQADEFTVTIVESADSGIVAYVPHDRDHEDNALLLKAAPDLLELAERLIATLENILLHQGRFMSQADREGCARLVIEAITLIRRAGGVAGPDAEGGE